MEQYISEVKVVAFLRTYKEMEQQPDAIKNTLLPFLDTLTKKEDDEVVFAIAEELANIAYNF